MSKITSVYGWLDFPQISPVCHYWSGFPRTTGELHFSYRIQFNPIWHCWVGAWRRHLLLFSVEKQRSCYVRNNATKNLLVFLQLFRAFEMPVIRTTYAYSLSSAMNNTAGPLWRKPGFCYGVIYQLNEIMFLLAACQGPGIGEGMDHRALVFICSQWILITHNVLLTIRRSFAIVTLSVWLLETTKCKCSCRRSKQIPCGGSLLIAFLCTCLWG